MSKFAILVVDDNLISRLLPGLILRSFGTYIQVFECGAAEDALYLLRTHRITHVLLDINLVQMSGVFLAGVIRSIPSYSAIKLIAYTAEYSVEKVESLKQTGFDSVLMKPINKEALLNVLNIV